MKRRDQFPEGIEQVGTMGEHVEGGVHMEKYVLGRTIYCQCVGESEEHRSWNMPVEGFRNHVATDVTLLGVSGRWGACGWSTVQLDHDEV